MVKRRIWEIDAFRVVAMFLMIGFHFVYNLNVFAGVDISYTTGFWMWVGTVAGLSFIFVSGISSGFSSNPVKRGLMVLGFGMIITFVSYLVLGDTYIRFGILHLLGVCMILSPLIHKIHASSIIILAGIIMVTSNQVANITVNTNLLLPIGLRYAGFRSVDYYPLIPYLSVFMLGIIAYKFYYYRGKSLFRFNFENQFITRVSKSSLTIYLLHQPIILAAMFLFSLIIGNFDLSIF